MRMSGEPLEVSGEPLEVKGDLAAEDETKVKGEGSTGDSSGVCMGKSGSWRLGSPAGDLGILGEPWELVLWL